MSRKRVQHTGQARLFQSDFLEMLTKTHPAIIWGTYIPILAYLLYRAHEVYGISMQNILLLFFSGMVYWTFFEYIMHRFVFHINGKSEFTKRLVYVLHGNHHEYPRDKQRIFMPPLPSFLIALVVFLVMYLFLRSYAYCFFSGFILGYMIYGTLHYAIHAWNPPFKWAKPLWRNHQMHHYKHEDKGFGVSNFFWDKVFGTMFDLKKEKDDHEKISELKFETRK